jgi:hypothetical protein
MCLRERDVREGTEPHAAALAVELEPKDPHNTSLFEDWRIKPIQLETG